VRNRAGAIVLVFVFVAVAGLLGACSSSARTASVIGDRQVCAASHEINRSKVKIFVHQGAAAMLQALTSQLAPINSALKHGVHDADLEKLARATIGTDALMAQAVSEKDAVKSGTLAGQALDPWAPLDRRCVTLGY
jgi:hypothetical protein